MPTYEYECANGHRFEASQSIRDEPLTKCRLCDRKCKRLISAASFILKGPGWAKDGYSTGTEGKKDKKKEK
jgi:putative FmdB family regulatory protein